MNPLVTLGLHATLVDQLAEALIFADRDGCIRIWNRSATQLFGHEATEVLGQSLDCIIPERFRAAHWKGYNAAIAAGCAQHPGEVRRTRAVHKNGSNLYVEMSFGIVVDADGLALGSVAVARPAAPPG